MPNTEFTPNKLIVHTTKLVKQGVTASPAAQSIPDRNISTDTPLQKAQQMLSKEKPFFFTAPTVDDSSFDQLVLKNPMPVIVLFTMPGCGACSSIKNGAWQTIHQNFKQKFMMYEFVCSKTTKTDKDHDVSGHPNMLFFNKGEEIGVYLGYSQYEYYANYIKGLHLP